jgi:hypothetical protein
MIEDLIIYELRSLQELDIPNNTVDQDVTVKASLLANSLEPEIAIMLIDQYLPVGSGVRYSLALNYELKFNVLQRLHLANPKMFKILNILRNDIKAGNEGFNKADLERLCNPSEEDNRLRSWYALFFFLKRENYKPFHLVNWIKKPLPDKVYYLYIASILSRTLPDEFEEEIPFIRSINPFAFNYLNGRRPSSLEEEKLIMHLFRQGETMPFHARK